MHIAILTFDGFNELDSFIALGILNRVKTPGWRVTLVEAGKFGAMTTSAEAIVEECCRLHRHGLMVLRMNSLRPRAALPR